jgi:serine/threonine-protein kinase
MAITIGQTVATFRVLGLLGAGAMGEVYRAEDTKLGREIALKVLPAEMSCDEESRRRFDREARVLATLNHPGIAQVFGIDEADGACFIAMELVPGEDLARVLERGPLAIDEALDVGFIFPPRPRAPTGRPSAGSRRCRSASSGACPPSASPGACACA